MPCAQGFPRVRDMGGITTLGVLFVLLKRRTAACQKGSFAIFRGQVIIIDFSSVKYSFIWARHSNGETVESPTSYSSTGRTMREQYRCVSISRPE